MVSVASTKYAGARRRRFSELKGTTFGIATSLNLCIITESSLSLYLSRRPFALEEDPVKTAFYFSFFSTASFLPLNIIPNRRYNDILILQTILVHTFFSSSSSLDLSLSFNIVFYDGYLEILPKRL